MYTFMHFRMSQMDDKALMKHAVRADLPYSLDLHTSEECPGHLAPADKDRGE